MPGGTLLHQGMTAMCPHAGQVQATPSQVRVKVGGQLALVQSDLCMVSGCAFTVGTKPQPCVKVQWIVAAVRVKMGGQPALLKTSVGLCQSADQIPAGPPQIVQSQVRVSGQ